MNWRKIKWTGIVALAVLTLSYLPATVIQAKTVNIVVPRDLKTVDPAKARTLYDLQILEHIYEGLVSRDGNFKIKPGLAVSWALIEPTRWRFFLRQGVTFHDGSPFTAADVVANFDYMQRDSMPRRFLFERVKEVVRIDDHTVDFITYDHDPVMYSGWHHWLMQSKRRLTEKIDSGANGTADAQSEQSQKETPKKNTVKKSNTKKAESKKTGPKKKSETKQAKKQIEVPKANRPLPNVYGTGPFMIVARAKNKHTELKSFSKWWGKPQHNLTRIRIEPFNGPDRRLKRLLEVKVDVVTGLPVDAIAKLKDHKKLDLASRTGLRTIFLYFDQGRDPLPGRTALNPFKDSRVREAIRHAIDFESLTEKLLKDSAISMSGLMAPKLMRNPLSQIVRVHDINQAKELMADAGYRRGFTVRLDCPSDQFRLAEKVCTKVSEDLRDANIRSILEISPLSTLAPRLLRPKSDYHMGILAWQPPTYDGYNLIYNLLASWDPVTSRGRFNLSRISDLRINELTDEIRTEKNLGVRGAMISEALNIVRRNNYYIPLYRERHLVGKRKNIRLKLRPDGALMLNRLVKN